MQANSLGQKEFKDEVVNCNALSVLRHPTGDLMLAVCSQNDINDDVLSECQINSDTSVDIIYPELERRLVVGSNKTVNDMIKKHLIKQKKLLVVEIENSEITSTYYAYYMDL